MAKWIQKAIKHPGALTKTAKAKGMTVTQFSRKVAGNPTRYSTVTRRRVALAKTLKGFNK